MTDGNTEILKFRGPGSGGKGASAPKGRQIDPDAAAEISALLGAMPRRRDLLIEALHLIQDTYRCLSSAHLATLAAEFRLALVEVFETATFYHHFDVLEDGDAAPPEITVRVCDSLSCEMAGARDLIATLKAEFGDAVRVMPAPCIGACDRAPAAVVGQNPIFAATPDRIAAAVDKKEISPPVPGMSITTPTCSKADTRP